jgi:hypothetical protein
MNWSRIPPPKPTPPGEWESFSCGNEYRGWVLRCGPAFYAQIHAHAGKEFFSAVNTQALPVQSDLGRAQAAVEEKIVNSVRAMLPAYKVIFERVERRGLLQANTNITPLHGKKD